MTTTKKSALILSLTLAASVSSADINLPEECFDLKNEKICNSLKVHLSDIENDQKIIHEINEDIRVTNGEVEKLLDMITREKSFTEAKAITCIISD